MDQREQAIHKVKLGLRAFVDQVKNRKDKQLDLDLMERAEVVDASMTGKVSLEIDLDEKYANGGNTLHGAAAAAIFDDYSCLAFNPLLPDWSVDLHNQTPPGGVTRALNVSYLRAIPLPARVRVNCEVISNGRVATFARATMTSPDGKKIYATCEHHKMQIVDPKKLTSTGAKAKGWTKL